MPAEPRSPLRHLCTTHSVVLLSLSVHFLEGHLEELYTQKMANRTAVQWDLMWDFSDLQHFNHLNSSWVLCRCAVSLRKLNSVRASSSRFFCWARGTLKGKHRCLSGWDCVRVFVQYAVYVCLGLSWILSLSQKTISASDADRPQRYFTVNGSHSPFMWKIQQPHWLYCQHNPTQRHTVSWQTSDYCWGNSRQDTLRKQKHTVVLVNKTTQSMS